MSTADFGEAEVQRLYEQLERDAEASGYQLNPDREFTLELVRGLLTNEQRYGYWACPCRLAAGEKERDLDIICPCDYRDSDLDEFDTCYCALYVSTRALRGEAVIGPIPERRPPAHERRTAQLSRETASVERGELATPVWRCRVCGYLCGRESPPETCPICKAKRERFERFL